MKAPFALLLFGTALAVAGIGQAQSPVSPAGSGTPSANGQAAAPQARLQQFCGQQPDKCAQVLDYCKNNPDQCKQARQQMQARRQQFQQECQQDPASCEQKRQALRQQFQQRLQQARAPASPADAQ